jgi:hypothetical protein
MVPSEAAAAHYLRAPKGTDLVRPTAFQHRFDGQQHDFRGSFAWHDPCLELSERC